VKEGAYAQEGDAEQEKSAEEGAHRPECYLTVAMEREPTVADFDTPEHATALKLFVVLARAAHAVAMRAQRDVEGRGLSLTDFSVMEALYHRGPLPLGEIGHRVLRQSGSITYAVDKLEARGWVRRQPSTEDQRVTFAELTCAGRELMDGVFPEHSEMIREMMAALTPEEQKTTIALLKRLGKSI
jgi:MarR family transcriptional regulator, 2-MHQ and catechol-resistance regulon repressor